MKASRIKLLVIWNVILSTLVVVLLGLYASAAQAGNDPPVRVFQANSDHGASGKGTFNTGSVAIKTHDKWTLVHKLSIDLSGDHNHQCAVTVSSSIYNNPGNSEDNKYEFVLTRDDPNPAGGNGTTRYIDFDNGRTVWDHDDQTVSSGALYHSTNEPHTFYWFARKLSDDASPPSYMYVTNTSMYAICVKNLQK